MEHGEGSSERRFIEEGFVPSEAKKQWKNPSQVQILENAYAVAPNPSAAMKEELAKVTGLDYKQVQYWFGNRRYMDRHGPRRYRSRNEGDWRYVKLAVVPSPGLSTGSVPSAGPINGTESMTLKRNGEMLQAWVPEGQAAIQAEIVAQMPPELQRVVEHIEKKLGNPLRVDGPILGVEFKPVPPAAFGTPLANATQQRALLWSSDSKVLQRPNFELTKATTFVPISNQCSLANLPNEGTPVAQDVNALDPDGSSGAVQEYQFFPMQPSWLESYEGVKQTHYPFASVNISKYKKHPSGSTFGKDEQQLDYTKVQKMVDSKKERDWGVPEVVGHGDHGQGSHHLGGQDVCHLQTRWIENQSSVIVAFAEVVNRNHNEAIMNKTKSDLPHQVGHRNGYNRYFVRPRERSQSSTLISEDARVRYFSDIGGCARLLIAEWNEREKRAVYTFDDDENDLSWSIGSDSTFSDGFDDEATENGKHYAKSNSVYLFGIDAREDDVGVVHEGQEVMDVDQNVEDDEDETDYEDHKDQEVGTRDKNIDVDIDGRISPLSSEQTAK